MNYPGQAKATVYRRRMATPGEPQSDRDKDERIHLLVLLIWFGGLIGLLMSHHLDPYETWPWAALKLFIALTCMFVLGCLAFASVTERGFVDRSLTHQCIVLLGVGALAAISVESGSAAFLMLILCGFALNWWGTGR
jgi:cation transport ATPase